MAKTKANPTDQIDELAEWLGSFQDFDPDDGELFRDTLEGHEKVCAESANSEMTMSEAEANLAEEVDKLAELRGWFRPDDDEPFYGIIKSYQNGAISLENAVDQIVGPINRAYSTGPLRAENTESDAQAQEGENGSEEVVCDTEVKGEGHEMPRSMEGMLWELWYSVLHEAKKTPWHDSGSNAQSRLVHLVKALHAQPDPAPPSLMTEEMKKDWCWAPGTLWSGLLLIGPATREVWNDGPWYYKTEAAEILAWTNVNAFLARLTAEGVTNFRMFALWALQSGVEEVPSTKLDVMVPPAAVCMIVLGSALYVWEKDLTRENLRSGNTGVPGTLSVKRGAKAKLSKTRWGLWKERFEVLRRQENLQQYTRDIAAEAYTKMEECESTSQDHDSLS